MTSSCCCSCPIVLAAVIIVRFILLISPVAFSAHAQFHLPLYPCFYRKLALFFDLPQKLCKPLVNQSYFEQHLHWNVQQILALTDKKCLDYSLLKARADCSAFHTIHSLPF